MKITEKHVILSELLREFEADQPEFTRQLRIISKCDGCGKEYTADELELKCRKLFPKLLDQILEARSNRETRKKMEEILNPQVLEKLNDEFDEVIHTHIVESHHQEEEISPELKNAAIETPGAENNPV